MFDLWKIKLRTTDEHWNSLKNLNIEQLSRMGLQAWDFKENVGTLMLFPYQWFDMIPDKFKVTNICWVECEFDKKTASDDRRFGALAFGIVVKEKHEGFLN